MKKNYSNKLLIILFFTAFYSNSIAQIIPSSTDLSYLLNPSSELEFSHKVISNKDKKWIILDVLSKNNAESDSLIFGYAFTDNLDEPLNSFNEVDLKNYSLYETAYNKIYAFEPANNTFKFLVLRILNNSKNKSYTYIINLQKSSSFFISKPNLTIPILTSFSTIESSIRIAKLDASNANFELQFYSTNFSPAMPPMASIKKTALFNNPDTSFSVSTSNTLPTYREGVYSIFEENNEKIISFFRITSARYPQFSNINEIINASIYLFTRKEKEKLANSLEPKKDFDAFWLKNTNSSERASNMISAYFSRVTQANTLFTTYKQGWKTDMGMIYIIFGPPNKVFRSNGSALWIYEKTYEMPSLQFNFYLKSKKLDSEYFELERNIKYQNTWFRAIDLWRKGRKSL